MFKFSVYDAYTGTDVVVVNDLQGPRELARVLDTPDVIWISDQARGEAALVIADLTGGSITFREANRQLRRFDLGIETE